MVVSEENGQISLVERSRIVRNLNEAQLARSIRQLLDPNHGGRRRALTRGGPRRKPHLHLGRTSPAVTRVIGVIVHNWPLKLAAVGLATLLYGGLVLSQSSATLDRRRPRRGARPAARHVPAPVHPTRDEIRYFAPSGVRPIESDFEAWIDLDDVDAGSGPMSVPVHAPLDRPADPGPRVRAADRDGRSRSARRQDRAGPGRPRRGPADDGAGPTTVDPTEVHVIGPATVLARVVEARASV